MRVTDHGSFWNWLGTDDGGMPIHLPIGVNVDGQGPESDAVAHHFVCWCGDVECPLTHALALADARARADEQDTKFAQLDHAEAVAAKLVEVICDDEHWRSEARLEAVKRAYAERDAARAEVAALKQAWDTGIKAVEYRVLADLTAKVRMIPAHAVRMENKWMNGRGWVPTTEVIYTVPLAAVLALLEADNA